MKFVKWHELSMHNIVSWPIWFKRVYYCIPSIFLLVLGYGYFIQNQVQEWTNLQATESKLKTYYAAHYTKSLTIQEYQHQLDLAHQYLLTLLQGLSAHNELPDVLEAISKAGLRRGLKFTLLRPQTEVGHDFYAELPIHISVKGNFEQLLYFLNRLTNMKKLVILDDLTISQTEPQKIQDLGEELMMKLVLKIYRSQIK